MTAEKRPCPRATTYAPHDLRLDANGRWYCPVERDFERSIEHQRLNPTDDFRPADVPDEYREWFGASGLQLGNEFSPDSRPVILFMSSAWGATPHLDITPDQARRILVMLSTEADH